MDKKNLLELSEYAKLLKKWFNEDKETGSSSSSQDDFNEKD